MSELTLSTAIPMSRYLPPQAMASAARALTDTGLVDDVLIWDQLSWILPRSLWQAEHLPTGIVDAMPDPDSFPDAFVTAAYVLSQVPELGVTISTDSVRRGPLELLQTMLSIADMTQRRAIFQIGAGELKQLRPSKRRRNGLSRLEDVFDVFHQYMDADGPISFEGNDTTLDNAWIGGAKANRPAVWALGGGPKLMDIACRKADGFGTCAPGAWPNPEMAAKTVSSMREGVEAAGRDPGAFEFGVGFVALIHEDEEVIRRAMKSTIIRWQAAIIGRLNMNDWDAEGIEPPMPRDWHYAAKLEPMKVTAQEADEVIDRVTDELVRKSWLIGSPKEVAAQLKGFQDAGVNVIQLYDQLPFALDLEEGTGPLDRTLDVFRILKGK